MTLSRLNAIVDVEAAARAGWAADALAAACVAGGARFLQVRAKSLSGGAFLELAGRVCEIAHRAGAIVVVNDRADIARLAGADGVHVGQDDVSSGEVRAIVGVGAIVGVSTHTAPQLDAAIDAGVTYAALGPVFSTATKSTGYEAVGLDRVAAAAHELRRRRLPARPAPIGVVAIGGITLENAWSVIQAGAVSVAVIADLLATGDPQTRVAAYLARLNERGNV